MRIFGYMRFSYLGRSDARLTKNVSGQQKLDLVFHPDRMAQRFYVFENITLPSIKSQRCKKFKIYILASPDMPSEYQDRLGHLTKDVPEIEVVYDETETASEAFDKIIETHVKAANQRTLHFRMDDDDALSCYAIQKLDDMIQFMPKKSFVTMPRGLFLMARDSEVHLMRKFEPDIAIAWGVVAEPGQVRNPYRFDHQGCSENLPGLNLPNIYAYIHCAYESCDTEPAQIRKLRRATQHDPEYQTDNGKHRVQKVLRTDFPWTNHDRLTQIMKEIPKGKKTAIWIHGEETQQRAVN